MVLVLSVPLFNGFTKSKAANCMQRRYAIGHSNDWYWSHFIAANLL
jgi:hypothetical protein